MEAGPRTPAPTAGQRPRGDRGRTRSLVERRAVNRVRGAGVHPRVRPRTMAPIKGCSPARPRRSTRERPLFQGACPLLGDHVHPGLLRTFLKAVTRSVTKMPRDGAAQAGTHETPAA